MRWIALQACITEPVVMSEAAVQRAISCIALGFTPRVTLLDEAVLIEVSGSLRLFGGLLRLVQLLEQHLALFFESNQAIAQVTRAQGATSLIALGRLRLRHHQPEAAKRRIADLPMHTLSAARPHLSVLERIGCRTWDDLLRLPRDGVARRFGAPLLEALDRARGRLPDGYEWLSLPEHFDETLELNAQVEHAPALMAGVERLLLPLQAWLLGRQSGICALSLTWHMDQRRYQLAAEPPTGELVIRTAQPAQDLRHVARLIAEHLAQQRLSAPVNSVRLQSLETERLVDAAAATSSLLMEARQQGDSAVQLIERLSARLGEEQVQTWQPQADHRPEQMQRWVNAIDKSQATQATQAVFHSATKSIAAYASIQRATGIKDSKNNLKNEVLYPTWLLPEPLKLAARGDSPVYQGPLVRLAGPQRLEATGWLMSSKGASASDDKLPAIRDYFIYRSQQAGLLWIYSERLPVTASHAWYLHGFFA